MVLESLWSLLTALPHLDGLVHGPRDNVGMCPVEVNRSAKVGVALQPLTASLVRDVPHPQAFIVRGWEQIFSARMPGQAPHPVVVAQERGQALARGHVPDLDRLVPGPWGQIGSCRLAPGGLFNSRGRGLRRPGDAFDDVVVFTQLVFTFFGGWGPDSNRLVVGTGGEKAAVGYDADHADPFSVTCVCFDAVAGSYFPHFDGFVSRGWENIITWNKWKSWFSARKLSWYLIKSYRDLATVSSLCDHARQLKMYFWVASFVLEVK